MVATRMAPTECWSSTYVDTHELVSPCLSKSPTNAGSIGRSNRRIRYHFVNGHIPNRRMGIGREASTVIGFWLTPIDRCGVWTAHEVDVVADLLFGVAMGALGGFFGIGGGLIAIPLLGLIFGVEQALAQGTALVMMVPNIALGLWRYQQRCSLQWRQALPLAIGGLLTAGVGASLAVFLDPRVMRIGFAVFLLTLAGFNLIRAKSVVPSSRPRVDPRPSYLAVLGGACGVLGGLSGYLCRVPVSSAYPTTNSRLHTLSGERNGWPECRSAWRAWYCRQDREVGSRC